MTPSVVYKNTPSYDAIRVDVETLFDISGLRNFTLYTGKGRVDWPFIDQVIEYITLDFQLDRSYSGDVEGVIEALFPFSTSHYIAAILTEAETLEDVLGNITEPSDKILYQYLDKHREYIEDEIWLAMEMLYQDSISTEIYDRWKEGLEKSTEKQGFPAICESIHNEHVDNKNVKEYQVEYISYQFGDSSLFLDEQGIDEMALIARAKSGSLGERLDLAVFKAEIEQLIDDKSDDLSNVLYDVEKINLVENLDASRPYVDEIVASEPISELISRFSEDLPQHEAHFASLQTRCDPKQRESDISDLFEKDILCSEELANVVGAQANKIALSLTRSAFKQFVDMLGRQNKVSALMECASFLAQVPTDENPEAFERFRHLLFVAEKYLTPENVESLIKAPAISAALTVNNHPFFAALLKENAVFGDVVYALPHSINIADPKSVEALIATLMSVKEVEEMTYHEQGDLFANSAPYRLGQDTINCFHESMIVLGVGKDGIHGEAIFNSLSNGEQSWYINHLSEDQRLDYLLAAHMDCSQFSEEDDTKMNPFFFKMVEMQLNVSNKEARKVIDAFHRIALKDDLSLKPCRVIDKIMDGDAIHDIFSSVDWNTAAEHLEIVIARICANKQLSDDESSEEADRSNDRSIGNFII